MIFDLSIPEQATEFQQKSAFLMAKGKRVELKEKRPAKTPRQMRYVHLIMSWYGLETGYTLEEVKQDIVKRDICRSIFERVKNSRVVYRSFADVKDTKEMSIVIDIFRNHASKDLNINLPAPNETEILRSLEEQLSRYGKRQYI